MLGKRDASASQGCHARGQPAQSCAQPDGWQGKGQMLWRTVGRGSDGTESTKQISRVWILTVIVN